jgi:uncharacterized protein YdeI (YjbR/CyaY-like superfamily)
MTPASKELPVLEFKSSGDLRLWLMQNHETSDGIWIRIYKANSGLESVSFEEVLDEGLCFGWSESMRRKGDDISYLQRFTPRRKKGTTSKRNLEHVQHLIKEGKMMPAGLKVLGL